MIGGVAQGVERTTDNRVVEGSNPSPATNLKGDRCGSWNK